MMSDNGSTDGKGKVLIAGDAPGGNYRAEMIRQELKLPRGLHHVDIAHDEWCAIFRGMPCNCDPDVAIRPHVDGVDLVQV